jgi:hypothetical protein
MALNKKRDVELEEFILRAAVEIKQLNPRLGETPQPLSDEDCAQIE